MSFITVPIYLKLLCCCILICAPYIDTQPNLVRADGASLGLNYITRRLQRKQSTNLKQRIIISQATNELKTWVQQQLNDQVTSAVLGYAPFSESRPSDFIVWAFHKNSIRDTIGPPVDLQETVSFNGSDLATYASATTRISDLLVQTVVAPGFVDQGYGWQTCLGKANTTSLVKQAIFVEDEYPATKVENSASDGFRITAVAYNSFSKKWAVVMLLGSKIDQQRATLSISWPAEWIKKNTGEDYYISQVAIGASNAYLVVMDKKAKTKVSQKIETSADLGDLSMYENYYNQGYVLTAVAGGESKGVAIFTLDPNIPIINPSTTPGDGRQPTSSTDANSDPAKTTGTNSSADKKEKSQTALIVGVVSGCVLLGVLIVGAAVMLRRRRKAKEMAAENCMPDHINPPDVRNPIVYKPNVLESASEEPLPTSGAILPTGAALSSNNPISAPQNLQVPYTSYLTREVQPQSMNDSRNARFQPGFESHNQNGGAMNFMGLGYTGTLEHPPAIQAEQQHLFSSTRMSHPRPSDTYPSRQAILSSNQTANNQNERDIYPPAARQSDRSLHNHARRVSDPHMYSGPNGHLQQSQNQHQRPSSAHSSNNLVQGEDAQVYAIPGVGLVRNNVAQHRQTDYSTPTFTPARRISNASSANGYSNQRYSQGQGDRMTTWGESGRAYEMQIVDRHEYPPQRRGSSPAQYNMQQGPGGHPGQQLAGPPAVGAISMPGSAQNPATSKGAVACQPDSGSLPSENRFHPDL